MNTINPTPMTTPKYQKIPGESLTVDQAAKVFESLAYKFGDKMPQWLNGKTFWFDARGKFFLGVFADAA